MPNSPKTHAVVERRVKESFRTRACAAGLCVGAQIFLAGCAVGMPLALGSEWLAALPALSLAAWITKRSHFALAHPCQGVRQNRIFSLMLCTSLLLSAAFALLSMVCFAGQTLVEQARGIWTAFAAWIAAALCALSGGTGAGRLSFALRYAFPALLLSLSAIPVRMPVGLFPILGAGAMELGAASICMLFAAAPALMLALPPPEIVRAGEAAQTCPVPPVGFFMRRVLLGALAGVGLLFLSSAAVTYESILESAQWGARLRMAAGNLAHEGILQMLETLAKLLAMLLLAANMLCAAEQALLSAFAQLQKGRTGLWLLLFALLAALAALIIFGERPLLLGAPLIAVPAVIASWGLGRRRGT